MHQKQPPANVALATGAAAGLVDAVFAGGVWPRTQWDPTARTSATMPMRTTHFIDGLLELSIRCNRSPFPRGLPRSVRPHPPDGFHCAQATFQAPPTFVSRRSKSYAADAGTRPSRPPILRGCPDIRARRR